MTTLLAIETSADACSVAIRHKGECLSRHELVPRSHTKTILPMTEALLAEAGLSLSSLSAVAFGRGPGSFTGLRVCASVVQGLAFSTDLPCVPVSSLQALALTALRDEIATASQTILCCVDARMDEVYWSAYREAGGLLEPLLDERLGAPESVNLNGKGSGTDICRVGSGWTYGERLPEFAAGSHLDILPKAASVAELGEVLFLKGEVVAVEEAVPHYLRDEVAWR